MYKSSEIGKMGRRRDRRAPIIDLNEIETEEVEAEAVLSTDHQVWHDGYHSAMPVFGPTRQRTT